jgi:hypothetical protein
MKNIIFTLIILTLLLSVTNHLHAQEKSAALALGLSVIPSVVGTHYGLYNGPTPLLLSSFFIAPSLGHFYVGQWKIGLTFIAARSLVMAGSILLASGSDNTHQKFGTYFLAFCTCCAISLVDWIMIPFSVREYNECFKIKPDIDPQNGSYGFGISYNF